MKKMISLTLVMISLFTVLMGTSHADTGDWICPTCHEEVSAGYNYCPNDATPRPRQTSGSWPIRNASGVNTALKKLKTSKDRHQSFLGPNAGSYHGAGAYKPYKVTRAVALFREGDYVLVDLSYTTVGRRCVYFRANSLTNARVEEVYLTPYTATTTAQVYPHYGPGAIYDKVVDDWNTTVTLGAGTRISVFFEMNGWVFAEFQSTLGLTRAWIPADQVG